MNNSETTIDGTLPNFLVIGAFKAGTTSLEKRLSEHPEIYMSPDKETHYFAIDERYEKGMIRIVRTLPN